MYSKYDNIEKINRYNFNRKFTSILLHNNSGKDHILNRKY